MNNKIQEIKKAVQSLEANYPMEMWDWEEKQMKYLLSEYERLTETLEQISNTTISQYANLKEMIVGIKLTAQEALAHKG